jgi:hypothetical protein
MIINKTIMKTLMYRIREEDIERIIKK